MTQVVTIDNYSVEIHQRYAVDQAGYDPTFFQDASDILSHFSVASTKNLQISKWEELFETHLHHHPFASFFPPPLYAKTRNRFFSYVLSPALDWAVSPDDERDEEEEKKQEKRYAQECKKRIVSKRSTHIPAAIFERDKSALINLIDSIQLLNGWLRDVNARKLQYQKG